ncbi:unnamed protein product, partial [Prorocentrum cordatum]
MAGPQLDYEILGAVKVKDGLFIGDELAAGDLEFIVSNKVTHVINCAGRQVPNHWQSIGVAYLTYYWVDADNQVILDQRDVVANEIFAFIEQALTEANSILIHSVRGQSRSCCVLSAYMMKKYCWGLRKTMEFLSFRRPDMNLKPAFLDQLSGYESCLISQSNQTFSLDWNDGNFKSLECEDLLLRNTYINSQMGPPADFQVTANAVRPRKLQWKDEDPHEDGRLEKPAGADRHNLQNLDPNSVNGSHLRCVLKKGTAIPGVDPLGPEGYPSHTNHQAHPAHQTHPSHQSAEVPEHPQVYGPGAGANGVPVHSHAVPEAWAEGETPARLVQHPAAPAPGAAQGGRAAAYDSNDTRHRAPSPSFQVIDEGRKTIKVERVPPQRPPVTTIRDSLTKARRDSAPDHRPPSRDPSPKTSLERRPMASTTPGVRGDSPLRYPSRRQSSPSPSVYGGSQRNSTGSHPGVSLSGVRTTAFVPTNPSFGGGRPSQGMGAFRSGGPVRAKADLVGDTPQRRPRPQTAPSQRPASGSRPASPLGQQR